MKYGVESNEAKTFDWKSIASENAIFQSVDFSPPAADCGAAAGPARAHATRAAATTSIWLVLFPPRGRSAMRPDSSTLSNAASRETCSRSLKREYLERDNR